MILYNVEFKTGKDWMVQCQFTSFKEACEDEDRLRSEYRIEPTRIVRQTITIKRKTIRRFK